MTELSDIDTLVRRRITLLLRENGTSIRSISRDSNEQHRLTWQINKEGKTISVATVVRILEVFPDVSARWLLFGEGEKHINTTHSSPIIQNDINVEGDFRDNSTLNAGNSSLESEVKFLRDLVQKLTAK